MLVIRHERDLQRMTNRVRSDDGLIAVVESERVVPEARRDNLSRNTLVYRTQSRTQGDALSNGKSEGRYRGEILGVDRNGRDAIGVARCRGNQSDRGRRVRVCPLRVCDLSESARIN